MVFIHILWHSFGDRSPEILGPVPETAVSAIIKGVTEKRTPWRWWSERYIEDQYLAFASPSMRELSEEAKEPGP